MKIEFVKETKPTGEITYFTEINGNYVSNSINLDESVALKIYQRVVETKGKPEKEILHSVEVE